MINSVDFLAYHGTSDMIRGRLCAERESVKREDKRVVMEDREQCDGEIDKRVEKDGRESDSKKLATVLRGSDNRKVKVGIGTVLI